MESKNANRFVFGIIAIILGVVLFKQFDFQTLRFEKPALAVLYIIVFVFSLFVLFRKPKKK